MFLPPQRHREGERGTDRRTVHVKSELHAAPSLPFSLPVCCSLSLRFSLVKQADDSDDNRGVMVWSGQRTVAQAAESIKKVETTAGVWQQSGFTLKKSNRINYKIK